MNFEANSLNIYQRIQNRKKERTEGLFLLLVIVFLWIIFLSSNLWNSYESIRYKEDIYSTVSPTIIQQTKLAKSSCQSIENKVFFDVTNCPKAESGYKEALKTISTINDEIKKVSNERLVEFEEIKRSTTETGKKYEDFKEIVKLRSKTLNLNDSGESNHIVQVKKFFSNKSSDDQNAWIAAIAVADGNTSFKYSKLYPNDKEAAAILNRAAFTINKIYTSNGDQNRAKAAYALLQPFGEDFKFGGLLQFTIWSFVTWIMLAVLRRNTKPFIILPTILMIWSVLGINLDFALHGTMKFSLILFLVGAFLLILFNFVTLFKAIANVYEIPRWQISSRFSYPGFVLFTGISLILIMDISSRGALDNRYLMLTHISSLLYAFMAISLVPIFAVFIGAIVTKSYSYFMRCLLWSRNWKEIIFSVLWISLISSILIGLSIILGDGLASITSEVAKIWFIFSLALFLTLNGERILQRSWLRLRFIIPLFLAISVSFAMLMIAKEMGTLLVIIYSLAIIMGGMLSYKLTKQNNPLGLFYGVILAFAMIILFTMFLDLYGSFQERVAQRLMSWHEPFESINEDMAVIHWFRDSAPLFGYGFGKIPWSGYSFGIYNGVPKQMQSDYSITSLMAASGEIITVIGMLLYATWILWSLKAIWKDDSHSGLIGSNYHEMPHYVFLAWSGLVWGIITIVQMLLSSAGNVGLLPLTGITISFISFGFSSLLTSTFFLALIINHPFKVIKEQEEGIDKNV